MAESAEGAEKSMKGLLVGEEEKDMQEPGRHLHGTRQLAKFLGEHRSIVWKFEVAERIFDSVEFIRWSVACGNG